jgi:menaquinol-cytochrome c reductase iron-sulfur subunit
VTSRRWNQHLLGSRNHLEIGALSEALAYKDPGTPEEISRRSFMANAVIAMSGIIGLGLAIPLLGSLVPAKEASGGSWSPLNADDFKKFEASTNIPVKINLTVKSQDGYLPPSNAEQFVWGIKVPEAKQAAFEKARPDLFKDPAGKVNYPVFNMGFVIFSSLCPHLGCKFNYDANVKKFLCPCHGSQFTADAGEHIAGPAPRGLDPLPFREQSGQAEITWIVYRPSEPARIIVAYS